MRNLSLLPSIVFILPSASAWWCDGHMLTAQVALDSGIMSAGSIQSAQAIIAEIASYYPQSPEMISSACWADDLKSEGAYQEANWHFIDIPVESASNPPPNPPPSPPTENVVWAVTEGQSTVYNKKSTLLDKSRQLRFIVHFVGDVHQPLHAASYFSEQFPDGDAGGNAWPITLPAAPFYTNELHAVWDSGNGLWVNDLSRPLNTSSQAYLKDFAANIMKEFPSTDPTIAQKIKDYNVTNWAIESNEYAATVAYTAPQSPTPIPQSYIDNGQTLCKQQIAIGGYRLASLIEYIFTTTSDKRAKEWRDEAIESLIKKNRKGNTRLRH